MPLCIALIALAVGSAVIVAYGTQPTWASFPHGIEFIVLARRIQGPLIVFCIALCLILIGLVVAGKRRAWWLVALGPILALFAHRFVTGPSRLMGVAENPSLVMASDAAFLRDEDYVVGVRFGDLTYAYPYAAIYTSPLVVQTDREKRMLLMWSAPANVARAVNIAREIRARDLEIVSTPANALLIYDGRLGQFINGLTGRTMNGDKPEGFREPITTIKVQWKEWRREHPDSMVMVPPIGSKNPTPDRPVLPFYPMPAGVDRATLDQRVTVLGTNPPIAVPADAVGASPMNLSAGGVPVVLFRTEKGGSVRAFDRRLADDLSPTFTAKTHAKIPAAVLSDGDSQSAWSQDGVALAGPLKGQKLKPVAVEEDVYFGVMKFWYPNLEMSKKP